VLALSQGIKRRLRDAISILVEAHMPQHHHGAEEQGSGVGKVFASDIRSRTMDSLEDRAFITNVARRGQTQTANQAGTHVGENVSIEVGHDQHLVVVRNRVGDHFEAGVVEQLGVKLNIWELLGDAAADVEEKTVAHLHDSGLVNDADLLAANGTSVLEGEPEDALAGFPGDKLDALNDAIHHNVLNARVLALCVLADQNSVDIVVGGLATGNGPAGTEVGKKVEGTAKGEVKRNVALANRSLRA